MFIYQPNISIPQLHFPSQSQSTSTPACQSFSQKTICQELSSDTILFFKHFTTWFSVKRIFAWLAQKYASTQNISAPSKYLYLPVAFAQLTLILIDDLLKFYPLIGPGTVSTRPTDHWIHVIDGTTLMLMGAALYILGSTLFMGPTIHMWSKHHLICKLSSPASLETEPGRCWGGWPLGLIACAPGLPKASRCSEPETFQPLHSLLFTSDKKLVSYDFYDSILCLVCRPPAHRACPDRPTPSRRCHWESPSSSCSPSALLKWWSSQ